MRQGLFEVLGEGAIGLKAEDLNIHAATLANAGLKIPEGWVVTTGVFDQWLKFYGLSEQSPLWEVDKLGCPDFVTALNQQILASMTIGAVYAIRSSALSERGGTGIYRSTFFVKNGNAEDLARLWESEQEVYASEFSDEARAWRQKMNAPIGMAILVQPVAGKRYFDHSFAPLFAGTAYTSYANKPLVRIVAGLGTESVAGGGQVFHATPDESEIETKSITVINEEGRKVGHGGYIPKYHVSAAKAVKALQMLFEKMKVISREGDLYLEWAYDGKTMMIVQCTSHTDPIRPIIRENEEGVLIAEVTDIVNHGSCRGRGLIFAGKGGWDPGALSILEGLNQELSGYVLFLPQKVFSSMSGLYARVYTGEDQSTLSYQHFSNAAAVFERQYQQSYEDKEAVRMSGSYVVDHTGGRGGEHFQQLCDRSDIFFLGGELDTNRILELPGEIKEQCMVSIWDVDFEIVNDLTAGVGRLYLLGAPRVTKYTQPQLDKFTNILYDAGRGCSDAEDEKMLLGVLGLIPFNQPVIGFDPFYINQQEVKENGGKTACLAQLDRLLETGELYFDYEWEDDHLREYLRELRDHLAKWEE